MNSKEKKQFLENKWEQIRPHIIQGTGLASFIFSKRMKKILQSVTDLDTDKNAPVRGMKLTDSFFIHGKSGFGKTVLAARLVLLYSKVLLFESKWKGDILQRRAKSCEFVNVLDLILQLKDSFKSDKSELGIIKPLLNADLLVLDDLAAEKSSEWFLTILYHILNTRNNDEKSTIITSNLSIPQLKDGGYIDERIERRIVEMCNKEVKANKKLWK